MLQIINVNMAGDIINETPKGTIMLECVEEKEDDFAYTNFYCVGAHPICGHLRQNRLKANAFNGLC